MKPEVEIYDTTLRDGSQGEGINFSALDKLRIAEKLDPFGIHYIEGGWPGSNPKDMEFFKQAARRKWKHARIAAFSMTRRKGVAVENDDLMRQILEAETPVVTIVGKTLAAACPRSPARQAGREPGDDRRHGPLSERPRASRSSTMPNTPLTATKTSRNTRWPRGRRPRKPAPSASCCATPTAAACRRKSPALSAPPRASSAPAWASTRTTIAAWASPTAWPASKPAPRRSRAPSTATANAPATATSPASSRCSS